MREVGTANKTALKRIFPTFELVRHKTRLPNRIAARNPLLVRRFPNVLRVVFGLRLEKAAATHPGNMDRRIDTRIGQKFLARPFEGEERRQGMAGSWNEIAPAFMASNTGWL